MYTVKVKVSASNIEGRGVFTLEDIPKSKIVWQYKEGYDLKLSPEEFKVLPVKDKSNMEKTGYLSPWTGFWIFPPQHDPAQYTNHSNTNNLSIKYDIAISSEPCFIANRNINKGEELTNNYHEFDKITQETKPDWANK